MIPCPSLRSLGWLERFWVISLPSMAPPSSPVLGSPNLPSCELIDATQELILRVEALTFRTRPDSSYQHVLGFNALGDCALILEHDVNATTIAMKVFVRERLPAITAPAGVPSIAFDFHHDAHGYQFPSGFATVSSYLVRVRLIQPYHPSLAICSCMWPL